MIKSINIIGAGNVGTHLALALKGKVEIKSIYSFTQKNAIELTDKVGGKPVNDVKLLNTDVDLNLIAVKDDFIEGIAKLLPVDVLTVHTSGTKSANILCSINSYGSLYPLQTFTKYSELNIGNVPFLIEANKKSTEQMLVDFCKLNLSETTHVIDSDTRSNIHLAAVLTNNFSTQLLIEAKEILKQSNVELDILRPLLEETFRKSFALSPEKALTGPAKRGDVEVVKKQYELLKHDNKLKQIYKLMSELIMAKDDIIL